MSSVLIRVGTRGSALALWQAGHVAERLRAGGHAVEIVVIRTTGDRMQTRGFVPPADFDGASLDAKGIFIKEIEDALAEGRIDVAVHSLKDLPTTMDARYTLAAILERGDPRDVWVCEPYWSLHTLPMGGRVGTTSPRRGAQLLALRPDVELVEVRGNIDTRLRKLEEGACDALVLAAAGLDRLGRTEHVHLRFAPEEMCPAPGQGALALEVRALGRALDTELEVEEISPLNVSDPWDSAGGKAFPPGRLRDEFIYAAVRLLDDAATRYAVTAERATLEAMGGGCMLPVGVLCTVTEGRAEIQAQVVAADGEAMVTAAMEVSRGTVAAEVLGQRLATVLVQRGALELLVDVV